MVLKLYGGIVEDACWLHPEDDVQHINMADLNAILNVVNIDTSMESKCTAPGYGFCMYTWIDLKHFHK